ncbi:hypothetical protein [Sphingobacterium hungaricum]|uniref:Uncharacterized protein n=1 Tax=Sphingobacterium hungaricum TaxID=2082723 RepID=A0A928YS27_9SPHI|nr:hypothetical protein [Sphingobacterium hungaricum]MBE8714795.1 hypothetical protein [Sphingobacterium hungaricum]
MASNDVINQQLKDLTQEFCPNLHDILQDDQKFWAQLTNKFEAKLNNATPLIEAYGKIKTENSIPILMGRAKLGESICISFLKYVDTEVKFLFDSLLPELKQKGKNLFKRLFLEFDLVEMQDINPTYLNGISEILTANTLIRSGDYQITDIESPLSNGKTADFELVNETGKKSYVEVYNKHLKAKIPSLEQLTIIVDQAIIAKLDSKTNGLSAEEKADLFLTITLWPETEVQEYVETYSESFSLQKLNVLAPTILTQYDSNGVKSFGFGFVKNLELDGSNDKQP